MRQTPWHLYQQRLAAGELEPDPAQADAVTQLDHLARRLDLYQPPKRGFLGRFFGHDGPAPRGLYLWGGVGRGKTMLMDLFFEAAPVAARRRVHFHEFMDEVHERIHVVRQAIKDGEVRYEEPIAPVAKAIADEARLLCFDEFHVHDIADAMILGRLFAKLFAQGVVVVATSNVPPDGLYRDGLNRALFLPFIALLQERVETVRLDARQDYRLDKLSGAPVYHTPIGPPAERAMDEAWARIAGPDGAKPARLDLKGRVLTVPRAARGAARFSFADLCEKPLGPADFLKVAHAFHTVLIDCIPCLAEKHRNEVRRFIILIDALYDNGVKLVASAAGEPHEIGPDDELAFEFQRTASRLVEMRSEAYLAAPRGGGDD